MNSRTRLSISSLLLSACISTAAAQVGTDSFSSIGATTARTKSYQSQGAVIILTVYNEKHAYLDRQAVVKLENQATRSTSWETTADKAEAYFVDLGVGPYDIEVSAVGYLTAHKLYNVGSAAATFRVEVTLQRDPTSVELNQPNAPDLPAKARKAIQRGVRALRSGNLPEAKKQLETAYKVVPGSADVNFMLGYVYFLKGDLPQAQNFLAKAVTGDPRNVQALTVLGRIRLHRVDYSAAQATLEEAIAADSSYWMAHYLLGEAYLKNGAYDKARAQAQLAIEMSKGAGNAALLVLGQALANLGKNDEAIVAFEKFLSKSPDATQAPQVHLLIAQIKGRPSTPSATAPATPISLPASEQLVDDTALRLSIKTWEPPGIDDSKPSVAAGVACPADQVIIETGARVKQLVDDISKFAAVEDLLHENVDELGNAITKETKKYNYVAAISEAKAGFLEVEEIRTEHSEMAQFPDGMASKGFPTLALVFHPNMRDNFEFSCEGLGEWKGQATWLVHFRQRDDRPNRIHDFKIGAMIYPVNLKGRAWITADKFQIIRIESELVKPMPTIQLLTEHQIVEYGPVHFQKKNLDLWLPKNAELYFDFRKHRYFRRHSFDHFMLFSTDSDEKYGGPKKDPKVPASNPSQDR